ncbi:G-type lectin S-receptor-like serine/threonine-protein kinase At4g27290 isoform X2 [Citrus sinensis]|uniref:G-type lectin S-receptor-like serine/threonine-protein kinase At4g27290 isoform X2 n=1 Tax=Citrus sinensis TaxID=2711 RepID=UPI000D62E8CD|nr:G-type lectin S-receptor-like serine/threonine-protein kinase At4g27290 isoform X2 [Citrus sinensis]
MGNPPFFFTFSCFVFLLGSLLSLATDTITPATLIGDGEKLVSSSQIFELGFFSPGKSKYKYLGIWYKQVPDTVVWVANRNSPIVDSNAVLTIGNNGNLVLLNQTDGIIWSSNLSREVKNPVAQLLDTGNLVLREKFSSNTSEGSYLWQSFDCPSDTLLIGMNMGWDLKTGRERYLTSWRTADDPSPGNFTFRLEIRVLPHLCIYNGSVKLSCTGPWNGLAFGADPTNTSYLFRPIVEQKEDEIIYRYESYSSRILMMLKINPSGDVQRLIWHEMSTGWQVFFTAPNNFCQLYGYCGANSVCSVDDTANCECLKGFKLKLQNNQTWPRECVRSHSSDCITRERFIKFDDIKLPYLVDVSLNESMNLKECEAECLKNCTCRAYANSKVTGGGSGCLMWFGDLIDIRKITGYNNGQPIYVRVPDSEPDKKLLWIFVILVLPVALLPGFFIFCRWRRKHKEKETTMESSQDLLKFDIYMSVATRTNEPSEGDGDAKGTRRDSVLPCFSLASVSAATENFSMQCKLGEGGFGPVYKGKLLNGQEVAVKRLSSQSGQGLKEFKNEMMLIAKLQHRNLVRLMGCCVEQGEKILIYEYMPNKSLNFFLFDPSRTHLLGWQTRVKIIEGIAQGLLYLHQYSRLRIIHRDLKASNILLDSDMNPKISDFGMARMFCGDELQGNTKRVVGTYGYMSPEYALDGLFSVKSDVFSFGVLLLETLTSKRNTGVYDIESFNLLGHAWNLWKDNRAYELLSPALQHEASYQMLNRYITVALLCVQEKAADRPTMSKVVSMITNEHATLPYPKQSAFSYARRGEKISFLPSSRVSEACSVNGVTLSLISPR